MILDHHPSAGHNLLSFTVASGKMLGSRALRSLQDSSSTTTQDGGIKVAGGSNSVRIDHCHFVINPDSSMTDSRQFQRLRPRSPV